MNKVTTVLERKFGDKFIAKSGSSYNKRYCQFRGGGDIFILHRAQPLGAVILTEESTYVSSELGFGEAYEEGELRYGAIEQKLKCESDLASQLKANMVLLSSLLLDENIEKKSHWGGGDIFNNVLWFACRTFIL